MSIHIMNAVWSCGLRDREGKFLLLAIADNANDRGEAFPSIATLGAKCSMSKSTVLRTLKKLAAEGWLTIRERAAAQEGYGRARGNLYCVSLQKLKLAPGAPRSVSVTPRHEVARANDVQSATCSSADRRGVSVTPRHGNAGDEVSDEVSIGARRGVKNAAPPTPPLVAEPSEPSLVEPPPPAPSATEGVEDIQPEMERLEGEYKQALRKRDLAKAEGIARQMVALRRRNRPAREAPQLPPEDATTPSLLRMWLMTQCGFTERNARRPQLGPLLELCIAEGVDAWNGRDRASAKYRERAVAMRDAWQQYARLPARWGPRSFFAEGHWQRPLTWPQDPRAGARVGMGA